jgi:hypothetical protein
LKIGSFLLKIVGRDQKASKDDVEMETGQKLVFLDKKPL